MDPKVLLVDDDNDILVIMETVLRVEGFNKIYKSNSGYTALQICKEIEPDIIVLDIKMPDIDGYEICRKIREFSMVPIVFLSAKKEEIDRLLSFAIGGDDYITKPFSPKEVVYRIKAILRREELYLQGRRRRTIRIDNLEIIEDECVVRKNGNNICFTAKEFKLLMFLVKNKNIVLSKAKIIDAVWGCEYDGFDNTLMVHIRKVREKIEENAANPKYIQTVKGMGYKFVG